MRWLFLFVLSVNLAYIAWQVNISSDASYSSVPPLKDVAPIVLLSEAAQQAEPELALLSESSQDPSESTPGNVSVVDAVPPGEEAGDEARSTHQLIAEQSVVEKSVAETEKTASPEQAEKSVAQDQVSVQAREMENAKSTQVKEDVCYTLGPFRDLEQLRALTRELKSYVVSDGFRGSEEKGSPLYWVKIEPEKNRKMAIATGERLKKKKIKDFYIIREGESINGISLGYYRNKQGAQGLVEKVKKLGFNVVLETVYKAYTVYWLDYRLSAGVDVPESIISKHIKATKQDNIARLPRQCT